MRFSRITCALLGVALLSCASLQAETRRATRSHIRHASLITPDHLMVDECCEPDPCCCDPCGPCCCVNPIPAVLCAIDGALKALFHCNACCDPCVATGYGTKGFYDDGILTDPMPPDPFIDDPIDPSVMRGTHREDPSSNTLQQTVLRRRPSRQAHASIRSNAAPRTLSVRKAAPLETANVKRLASSRRGASTVRTASNDKDLEIPRNPLRP
jgi:hypothetical protein